MIRFVSFSIVVLSLMVSGCTSSGQMRNARPLSAIDIDEVDGNFVVREFARICLSENRSISALSEFARSQGWTAASDGVLKKANLSKIRRKILEIPGGGGRYRETQTLLSLKSGVQTLIANMMERFDRAGNLVRTQCTLYAPQENHLPICAAVGALLQRPPDSNQKFPNSNSHFIRWNAVINDKSAGVRCDGVGTMETKENPSKAGNQTDQAKSMADPSSQYKGTIVAMIVDQQIPVKPRHIAAHSPTLANEK